MRFHRDSPVAVSVSVVTLRHSNDAHHRGA
jgi:hypothetical protein